MIKLIESANILNILLDNVVCIIVTDDAMSYPFTDIYESNDDGYYESKKRPNKKIKIVPSREDVENLLSVIHNYKRIRILPRRENTEFANKYDLTDADELNIIRSLSTKDFMYIVKSTNDNYLDNNLIALTSSGPFTLENGNILKNVEVYIKIDSDESVNDIGIIISMHEAELIENHPYE